MAGQETDTRPQLWDLPVEQALIGAFLREPDTVKEARQYCQAGDFFEAIHARIAELCFEYDDDGRAISPLTIHTWAKHDLTPEDRESFDLLGYMEGLAASVPLVPHVKDWSLILADYRQRRDARDTLNKALEDMSKGASAVRALGAVSKLNDKLQVETTKDDDAQNAGQAGWALLRQIEQQAGDEKVGCRTGLDQVDAVIGALYPGNLIVVAGRPGMGKSVLATNFARYAADMEGWEVDLWSLEMTGKETAARLLTDIDFDRCAIDQLRALNYASLVQLKLDGKHAPRITDANMKLCDMPITIFDMGSVAMSKIAAVTRARASDGKKRLVIIDHVQIIDAEASSRYENRTQEVTQITKAAKQLAKRANVPVVILSQLSRDLEKREDKRPVLADLRESGSIEQDADVVMLLYRGEYYARQKLRQAKSIEQRDKAFAEEEASRDVLEIDIAKNRGGSTDTVKVFCRIQSSVVRSDAPGTVLQAELEGLVP